MFAIRTSLAGFILTATLTVLPASKTAQAQGVGNPGQLPPVLLMNSNGTGWEVGVPTPIPVERDPSGPVWQKTLAGQGGGSFTAVSGQTFTLHEVLTVSGTLSWSDWHEDILEPNWDWSGAQIFINNAIPSGLVINNTPSTSSQGGSISFLFNAVPPGSTVDIFKHLTYNGLPALPPFTGVLHVNQYPTPEPGSLLLLCGGSVLLLKRRRHLLAKVK